MNDSLSGIYMTCRLALSRHPPHLHKSGEESASVLCFGSALTTFSPSMVNDRQLPDMHGHHIMLHHASSYIQETMKAMPSQRCTSNLLCLGNFLHPCSALPVALRVDWQSKSSSCSQKALDFLWWCPFFSRQHIW